MARRKLDPLRWWATGVGRPSNILERFANHYPGSTRSSVPEPARCGRSQGTGN